MQVFVVAASLIAIFQVVKTTNGTQYLNQAGPCMYKLNLDLNLIEQFIGNAKDDLPEDNADFEAFITCYLKETDFYYESGQINFDRLVEVVVEVFSGNLDAKFLSTQIAKEVVNACRDILSGASRKHKTAKVINCLSGKVLALGKVTK